VSLLLDTCTFLWLITDDPALSAPARAAIEDPANAVYVSAASLWEMLVKHRLGRLTISVATAPAQYLVAQRDRHGLESLPITEEAVTQLPKLPELHRDPFDRILICQAIAHGLVVCTPDRAIQQYPVRTVW
jgi:PIN domain nuclease of toxin-antitoxin system